MARDYDALWKIVTLDGYFSEYLPECFSIDETVLKKLPPQNCELVKPYRYTMSRFTRNSARRSIFIPEICSYVVVYNYIQQNGIFQELLEFTESANFSFSRILDMHDNLIKHEQSYGEEEGNSSDYVANIVEKIKRSAGAHKILKLDISNCYSSFYMHIIPTIILGYKEAEAEYQKSISNNNNGEEPSEEFLMYKKLDKLLRQQNLNQTNGLLPGPITSKIIAEAILTRIDHELDKKKVKYVRFVDDYEVFLFDDDEKLTIGIFAAILARYGFSLNYEKTEIIDFPHYISENLERIFKEYKFDDMTDEDLMALFDTFFTLEKEGSVGAIRFLLKSLGHDPIDTEDKSLYKAYLLSIIGNDDRSLTKACELLIANKKEMPLEKKDIALLKAQLDKHLADDHHLEVVWLLYLLIKTGKFSRRWNGEIIKQIVCSEHELAQIILLRSGLLDGEDLKNLKNNASSWILLYELFATDVLSKDDFEERLNLNKSMSYYNNLKNKDFHFCSHLRTSKKTLKQI